MLKRIAFSFLSVCLVIVLTLCPATANTGAQLTDAAFPSVSAESAVLLDAEDLEVLSAKNADKKMAMASTTKIMTALVAIENCDIDKKIEVAPDAVGVEGSSVYLYAGETLTLSELLYAMLLESANDAAAAIAIGIGGSIEGFCALMNEKASALGLVSTHFTNPHGLYDEAHYTTARELGIIAAHALGNTTLREIFATKKAIISSSAEHVRYLYNHNKMLSLYDGAIGVKTGFTKKSGRCLVSAAERDGLTLVCVTLNAPDDWRDHTSMLDWGFQNFRAVTFAEAGEFSYKMDIVGAEREYVNLVNSEAMRARIGADNMSNAKFSVLLPHRFEYAPIHAGDVCGEVLCYVDGKCVASSKLVYSSGVERAKGDEGFITKIKNFFIKG